MDYSGVSLGSSISSSFSRRGSAVVSAGCWADRKEKEVGIVKAPADSAVREVKSLDAILGMINAVSVMQIVVNNFDFVGIEWHRR